MITKYSIGGRFKQAEIVAVEVLRETALCVFLPTNRLRKTEQKELKRTEWREYYDTWEEAHVALMEDAERRLISARRALEAAQGYAGNVMGMRPPKNEVAALENVAHASQNESTQNPP